MDGKQFHARIRGVSLMLLSIVLVLSMVLYDLQIVNGAYYLEQTASKIANSETVPAARGGLLDRYGRILVSNRASYQVTLDTNLMGNVQNRNRIVQKLLDICRDQQVEWSDSLPITAQAPFTYTVDAPYYTTNENGSRSETQLQRFLTTIKLRDVSPDSSASDLVASLRTYFEIDADPELAKCDENAGRDLVGVLYELALRNKDVVRNTYVFTSDVAIEFITAVKENNLFGVKIEPVTVRRYETEYAAQLLGQVGSIYATEWDNYKEKGYAMNDTVGKDGMEAAFEDLLRGQAGVRDIELNQSGRVISESWHVNSKTGEEQAPRPGYNVITTLDIKLQEVVEKALAEHVPGMTSQTEGAACVITDMTGGILSMASYPTFPAASYYEEYNELLEDPLKPMFNRALQGLYAPGSTFKMVVAAGGLEEGVITTTEEIQDTGRYKRYDRIQDQPMCWYYRQYGRTHGWENVSEAIRDSCNIFFYETGIRLGIDKIDEYAAMFGLGKATGLELYEEVGEIAGPTVSKKHGQPWYEGDTMNAAIGQGNTQVTPIQLANYVASLVNGGSHYPTHLLKTVKSSDFSEVIQEYQPQVLDEINLKPENLEAIKSGMGMVASEGSVASYFKDLPVPIGTKTGTAQISRNSEANAILVAFAPYENPEIAISIVVEKGGSGSKVAAIAADILEYYFSARDSMEASPAENTLLQ